MYTHGVDHAGNVQSSAATFPSCLHTYRQRGSSASGKMQVDHTGPDKNCCDLNICRAHKHQEIQQMTLPSLTMNCWANHFCSSCQSQSAFQHVHDLELEYAFHHLIPGYHKSLKLPTEISRFSQDANVKFIEEGDNVLPSFYDLAKISFSCRGHPAVVLTSTHL